MTQKHRIGPAAREAGVCVETMRSYADRGLIECERIDGQRIFDEIAIEAAKRLKAINLDRTGMVA